MLQKLLLTESFNLLLKGSSLVQLFGIAVLLFSLVDCSNGNMRLFLSFSLVLFLSPFLYDRMCRKYSEKLKGTCVDETLKFDCHCNIVTTKFRNVLRTLSNI